jgi:hypothetical protein
MSNSFWRRRAAAIALVASALVAFLAVSSTATAAVQTKFYTPTAYVGSVGNTSVYAGVPTDLTVTLQNSGNSTQSFGSAELTIGTGSTTATVKSISPSGWAPNPVGSNPAVIRFSNSGTAAIAPTSALTIVLTVTVPATPTPFAIGTVVKQSNNFSGSPGNNFLKTGNDPQISVVAVDLGFATEPPSLLQQSPANPTTHAYMCPVVQATAVDGVGKTVVVPKVEVTVQHEPGTTDPGLVNGGTAISQLTVTTDSSGNATFGDCSTGLGATVLGAGFVLEATSPSASSAADSTSFAVTQHYCTTTCTVTTSGKDGTSVSETATGATFGLSDSFVGSGLSLTCDNLVATVAADPFVTTATTDGVTGAISLTFPKSVVNSVPDNGAPHMPLCAGAKLSFPGSTSVSPPAGNPYTFQGLLMDCTDPNYVNQAGSFPLDMCVQSRAKIAGGKETVVVYTSSLSDPMYW